MANSLKQMQKMTELDKEIIMWNKKLDAHKRKHTLIITLSSLTNSIQNTK